MSKIEYTKKSSIVGEIKVHIPADTVKKEMEHSFRAIQKDASFKGFRKGKVPMEIIKNSHMNEVIRNSFQKLVENTSQQAIRDNEIPVVQEPRVIKTNWLHWKEGEPMEYTATVELIPEPELKKYEGLHFSIDDFSVTKDSVDKSIQQLLERKAELRPLEHSRGVRTGDQVIIDFVGHIHGKELPDSRTTNLLMEIGANDSIREIGDALLGEKAPTEKEVKIKYPEDSHNKTIAGQTVSYTVKLHEIKQKIYPKLTDELAKELGATSVENLRETVLKNLEEEAKEQKRAAVENEAVKTLLKENPMEIPPSLVEHQTRYILKDMQQNLMQQRFNKETVEEYLKSNIKGITVKAEQQVKLAILLPQVIKNAKLVASDEEVQTHIGEIIRTEQIIQNFDKNDSSQNKKIEDKEKHIHDYYEKEDHRTELKNKIVRGKAIDLIIEKANITVQKRRSPHGKG